MARPKCAQVIPRTGAIPIADIIADRADGLPMDIAREKSATTANKVRNVMSPMFDWAIQQGAVLGCRVDPPDAVWSGCRGGADPCDQASARA